MPPPISAELVERAIEEVNARFPRWSPTPTMLGYARAVARAALATPPAEAGMRKAPTPELYEAARKARTLLLAYAATLEKYGYKSAEGLNVAADLLDAALAASPTPEKEEGA